MSSLTPWLDEHGRPMQRLELHLTYTCPERCTFCSEEHRMERFRRFPVTWGRVARTLREHAERGVQSVHLTGGEPTIHPRFIDVLRLARRLGMRTSVGTIGTRLCREDFAAEALPWLDEALFSLHGPDAQTHDELTRRPGSFDQVTAALRLAPRLKPDFGLFVNTVVTRHNLERLPETVALASSLGARLIVVSNTTPEGGGLDRYRELAPRIEDLARILPQLPDQAGDSILRFFGVPMCLLGEHYTLSNDLHWDPRVTVEWTEEPGRVRFAPIYTWEPNRKRIHVEPCQSCERRSLCAGIFYRYPEIHPIDVLKPFSPEAA